MEEELDKMIEDALNGDISESNKKDLIEKLIVFFNYKSE